MHHKLNLPQKRCPICQHPFGWRKKWRNCWNQVKYCSKRCSGLARKNSSTC